MKKKGFTLVELLAVIVILAIIAIIATPIILNVIETARKNAAKSSALGYIDALEKQIVLDQTNGKSDWIPGTYNVSDVNIQVKGTGPTGGTFSLNKKKEIESMDICIMNYWVQYKDKEIIVRGECSQMDFSGPEIVIGEIVLKTNMITINYTITDDAGVESVICEYGTTEEYGNQVEGTLDENGNGVCIFNNLSSGVKYVYNVKAIDKNSNQNNKLGDATTKNICNVVTNTDGIIGKGDKYSCDPGDGVERTFYVIGVSGNTITLLMNPSLGTSNYTSANSFLTANTSGWTVTSSIPTMDQIYNINNSYLLSSTPWVYEGLGNSCAWTSTIRTANSTYAISASNKDIRGIDIGQTCHVSAIISVNTSQMS